MFRLPLMMLHNILVRYNVTTGKEENIIFYDYLVGII